MCDRRRGIILFMPIVTSITNQRRSKNRRNVFLDGGFAFGCNVAVVARFRLREGMEVSAEQVNQIQRGEVKQECFDHALRLIARRLHSRAELVRKMAGKEYGEGIVAEALDDLARLGYVDDEKFAVAKAESSANQKHHARRRAMMELIKAGVGETVARRALEGVYGGRDTVEEARFLAAKQMTRLRRLPMETARRRLSGMLQRRGFDYEAIGVVVSEVLGERGDE